MQQEGRGKRSCLKYNIRYSKELKINLIVTRKLHGYNISGNSWFSEFLQSSPSMLKKTKPNVSDYI